MEKKSPEISPNVVAKTFINQKNAVIRATLLRAVWSELILVFFRNVEEPGKFTQVINSILSYGFLSFCFSLYFRLKTPKFSTFARMKKLFLLDGFALMYRAFFAFGDNQRYTSTGINTTAAFGFTNTLLDVLNKEKPTHIAVVFDTPAQTQRHVDFEAYKAHREEMPEGLRVGIPYIKKIVEAFNIPALEMDGYEADDVIGTLAKEAEKAGFQTYMMTPDKDFGQLVTENIFIYKPAKFGNPAEKMGVAEVCKKFEIERPEQVIDILGLWGDSADNIPGIPGVGEKTSKQLIQQFGSMENMYENTDQIKGKLRERVEQHKEQAFLSKKLATILLDAPVAFDEKALLYEAPDEEKIRELFTELEFRTLLKRVLGGASEPSSTVSAQTKKEKISTDNGQMNLFGSNDSSDILTEEGESNSEIKVFKTIDDVEHNYVLMETETEIDELVKILSSHTSFCFDSETTGLDEISAEIVGLSFSVKAHEGWYVPVPADQTEAKRLIQKFKPILENEAIEKVGQNIKYDLSVLENYDVHVRGKMFDTMLAHYLIQPDMRHGMDILSETYLKYTPVKIDELIGAKGKGKVQGNMRNVEPEIIKEYATEDADITMQLKHVFEPMLLASNTKKLFDEIEVPLIPVLAAMEREGIRIDKQALNEFSVILEKQVAVLDEEIQEMAGMKFNIASPKQLGDILFDHMKLDDKAKRTATKQYSTSEDTLTKLLGKHPIIQKILDFRGLQKLKSTYVDTLPLMINPKTKRVHTSYHQAVTATGRLSSNNPNLQNIPIKSENGREVRKAFVPRDENFLILSADYSQVELRIIAELSGDDNMQQAFIDGLDIHTATAAKVYGIDISAVTSDMRRNSKQVNFGIIYGISAFGLAQRLNIPRSEAAEIIKNYFIQYPRVKEYMDGNIAIAREKGYVETMLGRRRYLKDINSANAVVRGFAERNAINAPIQGSAADIIKIAMLKIQKDFTAANFKSKMLLQVHDELVFDAHKSEIETIKPIIHAGMVHAVKTKVPLEVEMGVGENWLEAH